MQYKKKTDKNMQRKHCKQLVYIYRDFTKAETFPSNAFITLLTLRQKRQDRESNGNTDKIQSDLCEAALRMKRIIVV